VERQIDLTEEGRQKLESLVSDLSSLWQGQRRREEWVRQALSALRLYLRDQHYFVEDGEVQIIDEYTGRPMADRRWEHGLHQMIEIKEGVPLSDQQDTLARISYRRFFSRYHRLAGMTGTAMEVAGELWSAHRLAVVPIPTHSACRRVVAPQRVFAREADKWLAVSERIEEVHTLGQPLLIGTRSLEASERLSAVLAGRGIEHQLLNARQDQEEAVIVARAGERGRVTVATNMAGRGTDIKLGPGVEPIGGLHVIGTERHDSARIDRQLAGRSARQGDPGSVEYIVSLEDELVGLHAGRLGALLKRIAGRHDSVFAIWLRSVVPVLAQMNAARLHRRMRRDLEKMDDRTSSLLAFSGRTD
jgi:preprotein translocase subunit SecA